MTQSKKPPQNINPPIAKTVRVELRKHGHVRIDDYHWLRRSEDQEVIGYLQAENEYTEKMTAHTKELQARLFEEFKERIKQTDMSVPYRLGDYLYYTRVMEGKDYPVYCRRRGSLASPEEIMLDANALAEGCGYFAMGQLAVSHGQGLLAYSVDTIGRRIYTIHFKDLSTGAILEDTIPEVMGTLAWANDDRTLFYSKQDPTTLRPYRIYRHVLGTDPAGDPLVYEEKDETFRCTVRKTKSKRFLLIGSFHTLTSEIRYLDADDPEGVFQVLQPRARGHEYEVGHHGGHFYIRTNAGAKNFRLVRTPVDRTGMEHWEEVIPHREDVLLEGFDLFRDHLVLEERVGGLPQLRIRPWSGDGEHELQFDEPAYTAYIGDNLELDSNILRFEYTSMTTPESVYDYDMVTRGRTLRKRQEIGGGYDPENYRSERLWARAPDGTRIPISLVHRKGIRKDGRQPLLLYGYGSYGQSLDASFSPYRVSLLDRGFVYAIAHVRGGEELGRDWYEDGKLFKKKNSFTDFIACAEHLVREGYTSAGRLFAAGGSAGGLLVGAVLNMRPELFHGVLAAVPFVDVLTTMLDGSIPLTTSEYDEWGDPTVKEYYDYMLSYSPYDNVAPRHYPHILVTASLHDSQVQYWEPAKWVAKLRAMKTGRNRLLLRTEMEAGHGGVSGRDERYRQVAFEYSFLVDLAQAGE